MFSVTVPKDKLDGVTDKTDPELARGYKFKETDFGDLTPA